MRVVIKTEPFDAAGPREVEDRYKTADGEAEGEAFRRAGGLRGAAPARLTGPGFFLRTIRKPRMTQDGASVQDEPSFEKGSFSARKRDSFDFELASKTLVLEVAIRDKDKEIPSALFDKLRDVAKKAASRIAHP